MNKKLLSTIAKLLVLVLLFGILAGCSNTEKEEKEDEEKSEPAAKDATVSNYYKAVQNEDGEALYRSLPKSLRTMLEDENEDDDVIDYLEELSEYYNDDYGYNKATIKVLDVSNMSEDHLGNWSDEIDHIADYLDVEMSVQDGRYVIVKITDKQGAVSTRVIHTLKIGGTWVVGELLSSVYSYYY